MCACVYTEQRYRYINFLKFDKIAKSKCKNSNEKYFVYAKISIFTDVFMDQ